LLIPLVSTITAIISLSTWIHNEVTNENEVSGEVDSLIDGIQSPIEQTRETVRGAYLYLDLLDYFF
jgi:hypothetical protein